MRLLLPRWALHPRPLWLLVWRLLERRSEIPEGETFGSPSYAYGKVTGLSPDVTVMTETTESPYVCCGYCSAGMACRVARSGLDSTMAPTAHAIRSAGGRPHNNGNNASELRTGASKAHGVKLTARAVSELPDRLRAGDVVTVGLDYAQLPSYLRVQSGSFGHAVMLRGWDDDVPDPGSDSLVGFFDPLWPQGARGAWARWGDVKQALWGDGNHSSTPARKPDPEPEPEPPAPPPVDTTPFDQSDVDRAVDAALAYAVPLAVTMAGDAAVVAWATWLDAPARPSLWDRGRWDSCAALWHRGRMPAPVSDAIAVLSSSASWDASAWRAAAWED